MLDEDPAKREAWSVESSALIYTTGILILQMYNIQKQKKNDNNKVPS